MADYMANFADDIDSPISKGFAKAKNQSSNTKTSHDEKDRQNSDSSTPEHEVRQSSPARDHEPEHEDETDEERAAKAAEEAEEELTEAQIIEQINEAARRQRL